jgi:hypothetical protein
VGAVDAAMKVPPLKRAIAGDVPHDSGAPLEITASTQDEVGIEGGPPVIQVTAAGGPGGRGAQKHGRQHPGQRGRPDQPAAQPGPRGTGGDRNGVAALVPPALASIMCILPGGNLP